MTFLAPIPALIAAMVCVPTLLMLYLLKLRRRPVRVGSILFWPKATEDVQANVPLRWLRASWLLLLHLLILACLLLAFARPAMKGVSITGERVVIVLDTSASMNAVDAGETKTRLDRAKQRAKSLAKDVKSAGARSIAIVGLAAQSKPLSGFTASLSLLDTAIDGAEPTDQPGDLGAALQLVDAMSQGDIEEGAASGGQPTVFLVSDGSFDAMDEPPSTLARVRFERVGAAPGGEVDNVGVLRLSARRDEKDAGVLRVFGELLSTHQGPLDVPVTLAVNGVGIESRVVTVRSRATVLFEARGVVEGVVTLSIARPDALACDDAASVVLVRPQDPSILLVQPANNSAAPSHAPTWLLGDILEELHPKALVRVTLQDYLRMTLEGGDQAFDLLVFDGVGAVAPPVRVPAMWLGATPPLRGWNVAPAPVPVRENSIFWDRGHALMRGVPLDTLVVRDAARVVIAQDLIPVPEVVARADDNPLIILAEENSVRHAVVCFDLSKSNWALTPSFAVFVANVMDELTLRARSGQGQSSTTDEPVTLRAPLAGGVALEGEHGRVVVREEGEVRPSGGIPDGDGEVAAGVLPRAGVYVMKTSAPPGPRVPRAVAINVENAVESTLASPSSVRVAGKEIGSVQPTRVPREVWHWFVIAAFALLAVEWVVYGWQVRA